MTVIGLGSKKVRPLQQIDVEGMRRPQNTGFTLIELMVVITIIGVVAAVAAPAVATAVADRKVSTATQDIVRIVRRARADAAAYGRAHLLRYGNANEGTFELYRGVNGLCNGNDWVAITALACGANTMCVDSMAGARYNFTGSNVRIRGNGFNLTEFCFQPNGVATWRRGTGLAAHRFSSSMNNPDSGNLNGGFTFRVFRRQNGADVGVERRVMLPLGSDARVMR